MFWENYQALCKGIGKSPNGVAAELGISSGSVTSWKNKNIIPRTNTLNAIADYFSVSVEQLLSVTVPEVTFWDNFVSLCETVDKAPSVVCNEIGFANSIATRWKQGAIPNSVNLKKIADYFGVDVRHLLAKAPAKIENVENPQRGITSFFSTPNFYNEHFLRLIPLFESASAGFGAYADSRIVDYYPCYIQNNSEAEETLCIRVQGNSMSPKIEDGDIIQVRRQTSVDSGSIAVVLIGGEEGYVKKVNYGDNWIELISLNKNYPPMRFEGEDVTKIQVVGIVKKVIKEI